MPSTQPMQSDAAPPDGAWCCTSSREAVPTTRVIVDGIAILAQPGESVAAALALCGITTLRHSPVAGAPRGVFCLMGSCQDCLVHVDGVPVLACMEAVRAGMQVETDSLRDRHAGPGQG